MSNSTISQVQWEKFLSTFSSRHSGSLVSIETHDLKTGEIVVSRLVRLESIELDVEDKKNPRINVVVRDDNKEIKHILFRPSDLVLQITNDGKEAGVRVTSVNTVTTVRIRAVTSPEPVEGAA